MYEDTGGVNQEAIAEKLNLSKGTVSRALRNLPGIHPATRSLVMQTAVMMGYQPQRTRRREAPASEHHFIGVLIRSSPGRWRNIGYLQGMAEAATDLNVSLVLQHIDLNAADSILDPRHQPPAMREGTLAGVVLIYRWPEEVVRYLAEQFTCVSIIHRLPDIPMDTVDIDHYGGIADLMSHLYGLGHRRIGFVGRSADLAWSMARFGGYCQSLYRLGMELRSEDVIDIPTPLLEDQSLSWEEQIDRVAEKTSGGVRAWMASSDWTGYALCRGLLDRGFRVPEDVSITGFDTREDTTLGCPPLTSVRVPSEQMGAEALRRVLRRLQEPNLPRQSILFECTYREGETTGEALTPAAVEGQG